MQDTIFPPTHWSAVLEAAGKDPAAARRAFEGLCADYRDAIVLWMRMQRLTPADAEDAAHDFLGTWLGRANPLQGFERGERRFREFLRPCLRNHLTDWLARQRTLRRGGQTIHVPWDHDEVIEDTTDSVPLIDVALARAIHRRALKQLAERWAAQVPGPGFERLSAVALGQVPNPGYEALARDLGATVGTLKSWVFRLRREYYDAFREAVDHQVGPEALDSELHYLRGLLAEAAPTAAEDNPADSQPRPAISR